MVDGWMGGWLAGWLASWLTAYHAYTHTGPNPRSLLPWTLTLEASTPVTHAPTRPGWLTCSPDAEGKRPLALTDIL